MKKDDSYYLAIYAIAIAVWNLAFTLIVFGLAHIILFLLNMNSWGFKELFIIYVVGYIILFMENLDITKDNEGE